MVGVSCFYAAASRALDSCENTLNPLELDLTLAPCDTDRHRRSSEARVFLYGEPQILPRGKKTNHENLKEKYLNIFA